MIETRYNFRDQDQTSWKQLLKSVGLEQLAEMPFIDAITEAIIEE